MTETEIKQIINAQRTYFQTGATLSIDKRQKIKQMNWKHSILR